jgi:hypothetical protein
LCLIIYVSHCCEAKQATLLRLTETFISALRILHGWPLYRHVRCVCPGVVLAASEARTTSQCYCVLRCTQYNLVLFDTASQSEGSTVRMSQRADKPLSLLGIEPVVQAVVCSVPYLSCAGFSSKAVVREWIALRRAGEARQRC